MASGNQSDGKGLSPSTQRLLKGMMQSAKVGFAKQKMLEKFIQHLERRLQVRVEPVLLNLTQPDQNDADTGGSLPAICQEDQFIESVVPCSPIKKTAFTFADPNVKPKIRTVAAIEAATRKEFSRQSADIQRLSPGKKNFVDEKLKLQLKFENQNLRLPTDSLGLSLREVDAALAATGSTKFCARTAARENSRRAEEELQEFEQKSPEMRIVEEIEERYQFLEDMEKLGKGGAYRNQIKSEIAQRMSILKRLTKEDGQQITQ